MTSRIIQYTADLAFLYTTHINCNTDSVVDVHGDNHGDNCWQRQLLWLFRNVNITHLPPAPLAGPPHHAVARTAIEIAMVTECLPERNGCGEAGGRGMERWRRERAGASHYTA